MMEVPRKDSLCIETSSRLVFVGLILVSGVADSTTHGHLGETQSLVTLDALIAFNNAVTAVLLLLLWSTSYY